MKNNMKSVFDGGGNEMRPGRSRDEIKLCSLEQLPPDLRKELEWLHGEPRAREILVPQTVLDARTRDGGELSIENVVPGLFIRSDGVFLVRDRHGERATRGESTVSGLRFVSRGDYINWAHLKVFEAFVGRVPEGYRVTFIDGNSDNCAVTNLALVSREG